MSLSDSSALANKYTHHSLRLPQQQPLWRKCNKIEEIMSNLLSEHVLI